MIFKGSGVALVTPFDENMNINYEKVEQLIQFHIANKTDAIIVCGTTGESATLCNDEKKELIKFVVKKAKDKIPVIAGTGSNNTKTACEMSKFAQDVGCDGILVVTPYYNKASQKGLIEHFTKIAKSASKTQMILYNVPSRTGVDINVDSIYKLSKFPNIVGIKEASSDLSKVSKIINVCDNDFFVYSGNDDLTLPILSLGGMGVISVTANICPEKMHNLCSCYFENDISKAKFIHYSLYDLMETLFNDVNPICIKEAMNILGYDVGSTRLPLCKTSNKNIIALKKCLKNLKGIV